MILILSGNPNLKTIRSVVYFANAHFEGGIDKVCFIDDADLSLKDAEGKSIEGQRNDIVRQYVGRKVKIESQVIEKSCLHAEIPKMLSGHLHSHGREEVVIDLTNGTKYISSVLYASASLSKISKLFFLSVPRDKQDVLPENLAQADYTIDVISPLENIEAIGKYAYFEIVYFREKAQDVIAMFKAAQFKSSFLRNMFEPQINSAISSYFHGNYSDSISSMGHIIEELTLELCDRIKQRAQGQIKVAVPKEFSHGIGWLTAQFCDPLRGKQNTGLLDYEEALKTLQNLDKLLEVVRVYRNLSSHPYDFLRGKPEANFILNNCLYVFQLIGQTDILK
jgi:predicted CoA-binding protein